MDFLNVCTYKYTSIGTGIQEEKTFLGSPFFNLFICLSSSPNSV